MGAHSDRAIHQLSGGLMDDLEFNYMNDRAQGFHSFSNQNSSLLEKSQSKQHLEEAN